MKTYLVAALALALALGTVPAMAKSGGGGGGGSASNTQHSDQSGTRTIDHALVGAGQDDPDIPLYVPYPTTAPRVSGRVASCTAILNAPRNHSKAQVDYCLSVERG